VINSLGLDLNCECRFCHPSKHDFIGPIDEPRQAGVCSADATSSADHLPPLRRPLSWRVQSESFSCLDQFLCLVLAQLTHRESLRDIEVCLRAQSSKLDHLGIRSAVARNTLANTNATRDGRIYADFAWNLIGIAPPLYTIDPYLSVFPWPRSARPRQPSSTNCCPSPAPSTSWIAASSLERLCRFHEAAAYS
jgi:hypothetical protein